jgi:regulator of telomere elongation helicase 1
MGGGSARRPQQIWVGAVTIGPSGAALNSSFRTRDTVQYKQDLGNTVANFARIIPDGVLVFFPSYTVQAPPRFPCRGAVILVLTWPSRGVWLSKCALRRRKPMHFVGAEGVSPVWWVPPTRQVMNSCLDHWKASGVMQRIAKWKAVVEEPRDSALFSSAIQNFAANLDMPGSSGAIFFAVCRGKVRRVVQEAQQMGALPRRGLPLV